jgi:hypothetical protein
MTELGKIEKPTVDELKKGRKLYYVPLVLSVGEEDIDLDLKIGKYWDQVEIHLSNLETNLGKVSCIFHEMVSQAGKEGEKTIAAICPDSLKIVRKRIDAGATLSAIEDGEILLEYMDWGRCLSIQLQSQTVFEKLYESYNKAHKARNENIAKKIDDALQSEQAGVIFMREGHQVQLPADIQVFYVAPPALDELKRFAREKQEEAEKKAAAEETTGEKNKGE